MSRNPDNMKPKSRNPRRRGARRRRRSNAPSGYQVPGMPLGSGPQVPTGRPVIRSRNGVTTLTHVEYVAAISNSVAFSATQYRINPGLSLFPWLKKQAPSYEKYRWRRLVAEYQPSGAVYTTTGSVYLVADYDPNDAVPASLSDALTYETRVSGKVSLGQFLDVSCARMFDGIQSKKVRTGPVAGDLSLFDGCSISVCTLDGANTDGIGILLLHYEVELISPQTSPSSIIPTTTTVRKQTGSQAFTTTVPATVEYVTELVDGLELDYAAGVFTLPSGAYKISGELSFADTAGETLTVTVVHKKNGANFSPAQADQIKVSVPAGGYITVPFNVYFTSDGDDTFESEATLTGAAGTLTGEAYGTIFIQVI